MFTTKVKVGLFRMICGLLLACASLSFAAEETAASDSTKVVQTNSQKSEKRIADYWIWPFENIIQPFLNALIYPIAKPIDYIFTNGVVDKSVDLITFGLDKNILIYPSFNFKPGSSTMLGANYRHRNLFFDKDYTVLQMGYYANGDFDFCARYTKHGLFGTPLFGALRFDLNFDRDHSFILPETTTSFTQPDSSTRVMMRLGLPLNKEGTLNLGLQASWRHVDASLPDVNDSILVDDIFPIEDRGLYQKSNQFPIELSLFYDNLDYPYAPSKGSRIGFTGIYTKVMDYKGLDDNYATDPSTKNHDFMRTDFLFQHYFFLGSSKQYILTPAEARKNRKFYTDFSWDEAMRVWKPENLFSTLFERRVIAMQFVLADIWEMEKGGAPFNAFVSLSARTPLRGYSSAWVATHLMSLSCEYRWPVDRFVDGVVFNEYALIAPTFGSWFSKGQLFNSWGVGIRVRQPNMYLFRLQFGFHGLHGVNMVITIAPEFK
ncbi:MAG: BamA/TamA family outer membrane protein [Fibrobacter sp.]|nr:BamA/TamA family outer membrane protein [Fibrobacter sp.]